MERFFTPHNDAPKDSQEHTREVATIPPNNLEAVEFVPKFTHLQEDLQYLFTITVTSEASLQYPWVKDEMYAKVVEELKLGTPFALDYFFEEKLLTKDELKARGLQELKPYAMTVLATYKGTRLKRARDLFIDSGLLDADEI